jgi:hypothetical protein
MNLADIVLAGSRAAGRGWSGDRVWTREKARVETLPDGTARSDARMEGGRADAGNLMCRRARPRPAAGWGSEGCDGSSRGGLPRTRQGDRRRDRNLGVEEWGQRTLTAGCSCGAAYATTSSGAASRLHPIFASACGVGGRPGGLYLGVAYPIDPNGLLTGYRGRPMLAPE